MARCGSVEEEIVRAGCTVLLKTPRGTVRLGIIRRLGRCGVQDRSNNTVSPKNTMMSKGK